MVDLALGERHDGPIRDAVTANASTGARRTGGSARSASAPGSMPCTRTCCAPRSSWPPSTPGGTAARRPGRRPSRRPPNHHDLRPAGPELRPPRRVRRRRLRRQRLSPDRPHAAHRGRASPAERCGIPDGVAVVGTYPEPSTYSPPAHVRPPDALTDNSSRGPRHPACCQPARASHRHAGLKHRPPRPPPLHVVNSSPRVE